MGKELDWALNKELMLNLI